MCNMSRNHDCRIEVIIKVYVYKISPGIMTYLSIRKHSESDFLTLLDDI
jgi:hypothetical protein